MDSVIHVAVLIGSMSGAVDVERANVAPSVAVHAQSTAARIQAPAPVQQVNDAWLGEDKFRHAGASWAAAVFTYAAVRSVHDDGETATAVALPVAAALGIVKELVAYRRGGRFSGRDLVADALGAGAAWLVLREVR
jgi:uncharacterized protein YfiM (DUF2279 family)